MLIGVCRFCTIFTFIPRTGFTVPSVTEHARALIRAFCVSTRGIGMADIRYKAFVLILKQQFIWTVT